MLNQVFGLTDRLTMVIAGDIGRIAWNIFLALIPLTLSFFLFYKPRSKFYKWGIYALLVSSFIIGIKKYNNGDILVSIIRILESLWGVRAFFLAIAIGSIAILMTIDIRARTARGNSRSLAWWLGLLLFLLILPNAPYILTDINSWSIVTQPQQFLSVIPGELIGKFPLVVILITFLIIALFYRISKSIVDRMLLIESR